MLINGFWLKIDLLGSDLELRWEVSEGRVLCLGEKFVVCNLEGLVRGFGKTSLEVVFNHHG